MSSGAILGVCLALAALASIESSKGAWLRIAVAAVLGAGLGCVPWVYWRVNGPSGSLRAMTEHLPYNAEELYWIWAVGPPLTIALVLAASIPLAGTGSKVLYVVASGLLTATAALLHLGNWMYGDGKMLWQTLDTRLPYHGRAAAIGFGLGVLFAVGRACGLALRDPRRASAASGLPRR